ncbi:response regulator transcription factor [Alkalihalobacillus oceani]|uniref:Response regulator transcription factor n=1 Tax=Halalkalibacter oceani TaxID=1653776 RepID=A0A9X2DU72_9BACI|nr:response regulator transcription factor [Halalkalibacter oceani]MCM3715483.1 response regulator transcription factor [Halalkalibacter oceani]
MSTIAVVEDKNFLFGEGIKKILQFLGHEINIIGSLDELEKVNKLRPCLLIIDYDSNPKMTRDILHFLFHSNGWQPNILAFIQQPTLSTIIDLATYDVKSMMIKEVPFEEFETAIGRTIENKSYIHQDIAPYLLCAIKELNKNIDGNKSKPQVHQDSPLSKREIEVLEYLAMGLSDSEISIKLNISERTVRNHVYKIMRKCESNNRTHLVVQGIIKGWVTPRLN